MDYSMKSSGAFESAAAEQWYQELKHWDAHQKRVSTGNIDRELHRHSLQVNLFGAR